MRAILGTICGLVVMGLGSAAEARQDALQLDGFERGVFQGWRMQGDCWGSGPEGSRYGGARFGGFSGNYYLTSAHPKTGDYKLGSGTGMAFSSEFRITHTQLRFRIGGGNYPDQCYFRLIVKDQDGAEQVARSQSGNDTDHLEEVSWDIEEFVGKRARLEIVDKVVFGSRAYILVDDITLVGRAAASLAAPAPIYTPAPTPIVFTTPDPEPEPAVQPQPAPAPIRTGPIMQIEGKLPRRVSQGGPDGVRDTVTLPDGRVMTGRRITLEATGYGPGENGQWGDRTALGTKVGLGTVAVDPKVIPLRTRLWVEGYGECIALDTGGAIKGMRIDLGFNDDVTANNYGRKKVRVLILD